MLQLRFEGLSQQEVANPKCTISSNISILEKRAHQNIERAKITIQHWMMIQAPVSLRAPAGTDVFDLPAMAFAAADKQGIQLPVTSMDMVVQLKTKAPQLFKKRALPRDVEIFITRDGEVLVSDEPGGAGME
jgi:HTH-type transcriptional regulator, fmd operon transcriptional regulator